MDISCKSSLSMYPYGPQSTPYFTYDRSSIICVCLAMDLPFALTISALLPPRPVNVCHSIHSSSPCSSLPIHYFPVTIPSHLDISPPSSFPIPFGVFFAPGLICLRFLPHQLIYRLLSTLSNADLWVFRRRLFRHLINALIFFASNLVPSKLKN